MKTDTKFNLKETVREIYTGYIGVITSVAFYVDREPMYLVENIDTTKRPVEFWYGESRLEKISGEE